MKKRITRVRRARISELAKGAVQALRLGFLVPIVSDLALKFRTGARIIVNGIFRDDARAKPEKEKALDYAKVFALVFCTTILTYLLSYIASALSENEFPSAFYTTWGQYDANHYINIAKTGYGTSADQEVLIVFLPAYPVLIKLVNFAVGGLLTFLPGIKGINDYLVSALIVSNICYAFAALYLYKLARLDYDKDTSMRTVFYFSIFPTAYFMHAAYTESLFLALAIASFYYARKNRWDIACLLGGFLTATKIMGIFIIPALALEYLHGRRWKLSKIDDTVFLLPALFGGFAVYLAINVAVNGNPLSFLWYEETVWNKTLDNPWDGFQGALNWFDRSVEASKKIMVGFPEIIAGAGGLLLMLWLALKYRPSYAIFASLSWLLAVSTSFWLSIPRYMLSMFPIFFVFSKWGRNRTADSIISLIFISLFIIFMSRFTQARWAF